MENAKPYYATIERFMKSTEDLHVTAVALIALSDEEGVFDVVSTYNAGPHELAACAGILQMHAAHAFEEANGSVYEAYEEDEDDE